MGLSEESAEAMRKAVAEGEEFMAKQKAHVDEVARKEAERRANLPAADTTLPEGMFDTKDEALEYLRQKRGEGKIPQRIWDANPDEGAYVWEISSPIAGHGPTVWVTAVSD